MQGYVGIQAAPGAYNHTPGFTSAASTRNAYELSMKTAKGMAITGWKFLTDDEVAASVRKDFENDLLIRDQPEEGSRVTPMGGCC